MLVPQGLKGSDNQTGWRNCRRDDTNNPRTDDVAFISAVVRKLVAIAAASGTIAAQSDCARATHPLSVLIIHGTDDPLAPYQGGTVGKRNTDRGSVLSDQATRAIRETWGDDAGPQVVVLTIRNAGHVEPSLRFHYGLFYSRIVGVQNRDLESVEEAWSFFRNKTSR